MKVKAKMLRTFPVVGGAVEVGIIRVSKPALEEALTLAKDDDFVEINYVGSRGVAELKLTFNGTSRVVPAVIREKKE
jgi:hypothetical protein